MKGKPFWESKTFWVNVLVALLGVMDEASGGFSGLSAQQKLYVVTAVNILLRFLTDRPVTVRPTVKK